MRTIDDEMGGGLTEQHSSAGSGPDACTATIPGSECLGGVRCFSVWARSERSRMATFNSTAEAAPAFGRLWERRRARSSAHTSQSQSMSSTVTSMMTLPEEMAAVVHGLGSAERCRTAETFLGEVVLRPHRANAAERILTGRRPNEDNAWEAGHAAFEGVTPLAKNSYKVPLLAKLFRRAIQAVSETHDG